MTPSANVTQWLAWVLMILTGSMNRPGGDVVSSRVRLSARDFRASGLTARGIVRARPAQPSGDAGVHQRMAVCRAARRDRGRQHPRPAQPRREPASPRSPNAASWCRRCSKLEVLATTEIITNETTELSTHVLPTKDQLERPDITIQDILAPAISVQHTPAVVAPVGERRSMWWVLAEIGRRLGHDVGATPAPPTTRCSRWSAPGPGRATTSSPRTAGRRPSGRTARAVGGRPHRAHGRLAAGAPRARRTADSAAGAGAAGDGAAPADEPTELPARLSRGTPRGPRPSRRRRRGGSRPTMRW